jgi:putative tryptophan/tyrosine transport system substrate-binding protein
LKDDAMKAKEIVALVAKNRIPAMFHQRDFVDDGGLMSYAANTIDSFRRAVVFVDRILKEQNLPIFLWSSRRRSS